MSDFKGSAIIGQSGGPSSAINASAYGAIKTALASEDITHVYGALNGIVGVLDGNLIDLDQEDPDELALMQYTPASALGSCRYKLKSPLEDESDYARILETFQKYDVRYFFYIGGNDSMDTCNKISKYCLTHDYACRVIGIPKTIDNDLYGTDHCPGYASAAKYIATSVSELWHETNVYDTGMVTIVECMGRHAGWLTAASALAGVHGNGPDLIYLPEVNFDVRDFVKDVKAVYAEKKHCLVAVSEGIHDRNGKLIAEYAEKDLSKDAFGHSALGGVAQYLAGYLKKQIGGLKVRSVELSLLQRCAAHCASQTDIEESFNAGKTAVEAALAGISDKMVGFRCTRRGSTYTCETGLFSLSDVANAEKKFPLPWLNDTYNGVNDGFIEYVLPLIQGETQLKKENGLPRFVHLKKVKAQPVQK